MSKLNVVNKYIISYDIVEGEPKHNEAIRDNIKNLAEDEESYWSGLGSTWVIISSKTVKDIREYLSGKFRSEYPEIEIKLLVVKVANTPTNKVTWFYGFKGKELKWIEKNF